MSNQLTTSTPLLNTIATRFGIAATNVVETLKKTAFKQRDSAGEVSDEQMTALLIVANEYKLNPFTREIYAFASNGGIQPIVSIDGWMKIINGHQDFDGMEFEDTFDDKAIYAVTCKIYRKNRAHPTVVTEYLSECARGTEPWKKWPARMLRHKAAIQCARYAFGFGGISEPDEIERMYDGTSVSRDTGGDPGRVVPEAEDVTEVETYSDEDFRKNFPAWEKAVLSGKKSPQQLIDMVSTKAALTEHQIAAIRDLESTIDEQEAQQ